MARNLPLSTIGVKVSYCVETSTGVRPTSGYKVLSGIYSTPSFNIAPNTTDAGDFSNEKFTTKLQLLSELPDNLEFGMRFGEQSATDWNDLVSAYETGIATSKETWFCIDIPKYSKSIFITGRPSALGMPELQYNSGIDAVGYVTPTGEPVYEADPSYLS